MRSTAHVIYPHARVDSAPDSLGWHLADALTAEYEVLVYDWASRVVMQPAPRDILIGHPHPVRGTALRKNWANSRWGARYVMAPYSGALSAVGFQDKYICEADGYLAITGTPWFEQLRSSEVAAWIQRAIRLDVPVDRAAFPRVKSAFAQTGRRKVLYIGHTAALKGPRRLESIAAAAPDLVFGHMGSGKLRGFQSHGPQNFRTQEARDLVAQYDFLIVASDADANPAVVVEAMSWGLVAFSTIASGYQAGDGVVELPSLPVPAAAVLREWGQKDESHLRAHIAASDRMLDERYVWSRFTDAILQELRRGGGSPTPLARSSRARRAALRSPTLRQVSTYKELARRLAAPPLGPERWRAL